MRWQYTRGLHEIGNGNYAWLLPDGTWGWSNAGLVTDSGESLLVDTTVVMAVQVNGKRRGEITVPVGAAKDLVEKQALSLEAVARMLDGKPPKKVVIVPNRIVNVVV